MSVQRQEQVRSLLAFESETAARKFGKEPFSVTHELGEHPLFALDALEQLADALPPEFVEHHLGDVPPVVAATDIPRAELTPGEVVRGIEENGCWMVLGRIQSMPGYLDVLRSILEELAPLVPGGRGAMQAWHSAVFLSAPGSTTPAHIDSEQGFLLQLRGTKRVIFGRFPDGETKELELEHHHGGGDRHVRLLPVDTETFHLSPGDGVHVPSLLPHWVENGDSVSISLSVGFKTPESQRLQRIYACNARLRRLGLTPRPPGAGPRTDRLKAAAMQSLSGLRLRLHR